MNSIKGFTPLHSESPSLKTGDEWQIKDSSLEKPRSLGWGVTGFTLMELLIVIAILIILSGAVVSRISTGSEKAKEAKARYELDQIASAFRAAYGDIGLWIAFEGSETMLENLTKSTPPSVGWDEGTYSWVYLDPGLFNGPYLEVEEDNPLLDPWENHYKIVAVPDGAPDQKEPFDAYVTCGSPYENIRILIHRFVYTGS